MLQSLLTPVPSSYVMRTWAAFWYRGVNNHASVQHTPSLQWRCSGNDGGIDFYGLNVSVGARITAFDILGTNRSNDRRGEYFGNMCARRSNNAVSG